ncbi:MAG: hypothetical protein NTX13_01205 [Acidobacteria bacterium]|nr:hypothetical protein [Acidobacteriota bacterium]
MGILLGFLAAAGLLLAEPNLSGSWRLNHDRSDFGPMPRPGVLVTRIRQQGGELAAESTGSGRVNQYRWTLDGKESVNVIDGNEVRAVAGWRGPILQVRSKVTARGRSLAMTDQYSLSSDGRELTVFRTIAGPQGEIEQRFVYDKDLSGK